MLKAGGFVAGLWISSWGLPCKNMLFINTFGSASVSLWTNNCVQVQTWKSDCLGMVEQKFIHYIKMVEIFSYSSIYFCCIWVPENVVIARFPLSGKSTQIIKKSIFSE